MAKHKITAHRTHRVPGSSLLHFLCTLKTEHSQEDSTSGRDVISSPTATPQEGRLWYSFREIREKSDFNSGAHTGVISQSHAFDENHIRFGLVLRNELPSMVLIYRRTSRAIRSSLVPQERLAEWASSLHRLVGGMTRRLAEGATSPHKARRRSRHRPGVLPGSIPVGRTADASQGGVLEAPRPDAFTGYHPRKGISSR